MTSTAASEALAAAVTIELVGRRIRSRRRRPDTVVAGHLEAWTRIRREAAVLQVVLQNADRVCEVVSRNLTLKEWSQFVGPDVDYECTCPKLPPGDGAPACAS